MKTIKIKLSTNSIDAAIANLEKYQNDLETKVNELCERLAVLGAYVLRVRYTGALYAGENDIEVEVEPGTNSAVLSAHGQALAFIEFGAGVSNAPQGEWAEKAGAIPLGSYGKGKGKGKSWVYKGVQGNAGQPLPRKSDVFRTYGNPAANAFPAADTEMRQQLTKIAREVFAK